MISSLKEIHEGQTILIFNHNLGKYTLALVEEVDGGNGMWIRRAKSSANSTLSESTSVLDESQYVSFGQIHCPKHESFYRVK